MLFRTGKCLIKFKALQAVEGGEAADLEPSGKSVSAPWARRASRCASLPKKGSMTVEAALVFPLFLFAMAAFIYLFFLIQLRTEVGRALTDAGRELSQTAYFAEDAGELLSSAAAVLRGRQELKDSLEGRAAAYIIKGGVGAISLAGTEWDEENSTLTLRATYQVVLPPGLAWFRPIRVRQERTVRGFTGFSGRGKAGETGREDVVYVTDHGVVYHRELRCRHLRLSVRQSTLEETERLRNTDGAKYYPCERCWEGGTDLVYLTDSGNRYHENLSCSSLIRGIRTLLLSEAAGYRPCSVCGGGG